MSVANSVCRGLHSPILIGLLVGVCLTAASVTQGMEPDEGTWHYIGRSMLDGVPPYTGAFECHPPGTFYVFALSHRLAGVNYWLTRLFGVAALVAAGWVLFRVGTLLHSRFAGAAAMLLFGLTMANRAVHGPWTTHTETYMVLTSVLALYWLVKSRDAAGSGRRRACLFLCGLMLGLSMFLFKQVAIFTTAGAIVFYLAQRKQAAAHAPAPSRLVADLAIAACGAVAALAIVLGVLAAQGVGPAAYVNAVIVSIPNARLSQPWLGGRVLGFFKAWQQSPLVLSGPLLILFAIQRKSLSAAGVPFWGIVGWAVLDFLGANSGGYYYPHQLKQAVPLFALAGGIGLANAVKTLVPSLDSCVKWQAGALLALAVVWTPCEMLVKAAILRPAVNIPKQVGLWVNQQTTAKDYVWAAGGDAGGGILAWSGRRCPSRYTTFGARNLPGATAEMVRDFADKPPKFIVMPAGEDERKEQPAWFLALLARDYHPCRSELGYDIFERGCSMAGPAAATQPGPNRTASAGE